MNRAEAAHALAPAIREFLQRPIAISAGEKQWTMTREELGVKVDVDGVVDSALHVSDSLAWPSRAITACSGGRSPRPCRSRIRWIRPSSPSSRSGCPRRSSSPLRTRRSTSSTGSWSCSTPASAGS
jgi:hypothetical protein